MCLMPSSLCYDTYKTADENDCIGKKSKVKNKYFSKIESNYSKVCKLNIEKVSCNASMSGLKNLVLLNSFDSANYLKFTGGKIDFVFFSTTAFNKNLISLAHNSTSQSSNILT